MAGELPGSLGLHVFDVPLALPPLVLGMAWHPRTDADPAQRWFRERTREAVPGSGAQPAADTGPS
ncbi:hypothetical protein [Pseudonocardia sp. GCM10023141]|uniref:hypothetical protein n=1 Tax=Pseudonocardia sp. GCM10023141 TaxID=3252653 RepID=UPI00360B7C05